MKASTKLCLLATLGLLGGVIAAVGLSLIHFYPIIFNKILKKQTQLVEGTSGYDTWKDPPADIAIDFYVWHLNNPLEVEQGAKPNITEKGPYTYRENRTKEFIQKNSNGTLSYVQRQSFVFDPVHSVGDPYQDNFTTVNVPLLTIINQLQFMPENTRYLFDVIATISVKHLYSTHTVHDFIWGYFSPLLFLAKLFQPDMVPTNKFGIYMDKNNSNDGIYTVFDGVKDYRKTNTIDRWKGLDLLPYWITKYANMINGTDGTYYGQLMKKENKAYTFVSDICRSVYLTYEAETTTRGVPTWRYVVPPEVFANHWANRDNTGFCTPDKDHCVPGGLLNISLCQFGAPVFFSSPHFLYADDEVIDMVNGVHPDKEKHETYIDFEPYTGAPLNVSKRSQINVHLRSYDFVEFYKHVSEAYLPLVWMQERSVIRQSYVNELDGKLLIPIAIGQYLPWAAFGLGMALLMLSIGCFAYDWRKVRRGEGDRLSQRGIVNVGQDDESSRLIY